MREIPECLNRRYKALDELIKELSAMSARSSEYDCPDEACNDPSIKMMCNFWNILKENPDYNLSAASFDKKCNVRISNLMSAQKELQDQIQHLEHKEKEGTQLLKQADCMWSCMEDAYKKKVAESMERQKGLLKELKEVEKSAAKWRKNKKDLESQLDNIGKCHQEITEKINQKTNDMKYMDMEIANYRKRKENNKKEIEVAQKSHGSKKQASDARIASIVENVKKLENKLSEEKKYKNNKEQEGTKYVKEAREDLQKICRVLLQKKLENEDLRAEKEGLNLENDLLRRTCDQCKEKCKNKQQSINEEIKKIDIEIAEFKVKCVRCHQCTDTIDVRKYCTDCPRCLEDRECLYEEGHCTPDQTMDCVCMGVKQKFLDNVFDNMYTVLERQVKTGPGRAIGEAILNCLKRSKNGKLDDETRKILQDFVLTTVKKNLNLTIVGGAVKTRCEMDPETYKQLMLCLKQIKVVKPPQSDKGTVAKKDACRRWGGTSECNCPYGPKACICTKKAPPPPKDPTPCPPPDKEDVGQVMACPHKESAACGPDCAMHELPNNVGKELASYRRDPCKGPSCGFSKNMRAAQCVLGPESVSSLPKSYVAIDPYVPDIPVLKDLMTCKCGSTAVKPCICHKDLRSQPRQRIIEEVLGRYIDVSPIDKLDEYGNDKLGKNKNEGYIDLNVTKDTFASNIPENKDSQYIVNSNIIKPYESRNAEDSNDTHKNESNNLIPKSSFANSNKINKLKNNVDTKLTVILYPKFHSTNSKVDKSNSSIASCKSCRPYDNKNVSGVEEDKGTLNISTSIFGREICDTVRELMKEIIVPVIPVNGRSNSSDTEWVTIESFLKQISLSSKTSKDKLSDTTTNEVEMGNELLDASRQCINETRTVNRNSLKSVDKSDCNIEIIKSIKIQKNDQKSSEYFDEMRDEAEIINFDNEVGQTKESFDFSLKSESNSVDSFKEVKSHKRCLYFFGKMFLENSKQEHDYVQPEKIGNFKAENIKKIWFLHESNLDNVIDTDSLKIQELKKCSMAVSRFPNIKIRANKSLNNEKLIFVNSGKNAKQLKPEITKNCDKSNCNVFWEQDDDVKNTFTFKEKEICNELYGPCSQKQKNKLSKILTVQSKVFAEGAKTLNPKEPTKNQFKIVIGGSSTQLKDPYTELIYTSSGNLAVELDEKVIKLIERKNADNPNLYTSLEKTESGYFIVDFDPKDTVSTDLQKISLKKTPSGTTRLLEVHKDFVNTLKPVSVIHSTNKNQPKSLLTSDTLQTSSAKASTLMINESLRKESFGSTQNVKSNVTIKKNHLNELTQLYIQGCTDMTIKVRGKNGILKKIQASITRTLSGNIGLDVNNILSFGKFTFKAMKYPVLLKKCESGCYILDICCINEEPNTVLTRTLSGGLLVVLTSSSINLMEKDKIPIQTNPKDNIFKLKIESDSYYVPKPPAVLKATPSNNYVVVLDKEFESRFTKSISSYVEDNTEYPVVLSRTSSGSYIINLDQPDRMSANDQYALLQKSASGNIKVVLNRPEFQKSRKCSMISGSKVFGELLDKLPSSSREFHREHLRKSRFYKKSSSDTKIYEKVKTKIFDYKKLLGETSTDLKKTASGHYAVVLSKESKSAFIDNLKSYLANNSQGLIPINRTKSGEITIDLSRNDENLGHYGSLKITPSGNIYVLVDEKVVTTIAKNSLKTDKQAPNADDKSYKLGKIKDLSNKAVTTTCNSRPDNSCDASKCVCKELQLRKKYCEQDSIEKDGEHMEWDNSSTLEPQNLDINWKKLKINKCKKNKFKKCTTDRNSKNGIRNSEQKSPHIVIKPCACRPVLENNSRSSKQCFYAIEAVCPYHINRYESLSNDLLEISGLCSKEFKLTKEILPEDHCHNIDLDKIESHVKILNKDSKTQNANWDSLKYLPPQLPSFLREVIYR